MPDADGRIPPVSFSRELPWKQAFEPGDRVRVVACPEVPELIGKLGTVSAWFDGVDPHALVHLEDAIDPGAYFAPGELRRVDREDMHDGAATVIL
jgi:hypothetical protein